MKSPVLKPWQPGAAARERLTLAGFVLAVLAVRILVSLHFKATSTDEYANIFSTMRFFGSGFKNAAGVFMWFYYCISALLLYVVPNAEFTTKLVSIGFGVATLPVIYYLVKRLWGSTRAAWVALILLATNPEFTLVSSVPLREPVYAFFVFLALLLSVRQQVIPAALSIATAFLTRMEGMLIGMPALLTGMLFSKPRRNAGEFLSVVAIFALSIVFLNFLMPYPFFFLTQTFRNQCAMDPQIVSYLGHPHIPWILKILNGLARFLKYLYLLIGPNTGFALIGLVMAFGKKVFNPARKFFFVFFAFHAAFWLIYVVVFGRLIFDLSRFLFILIPFVLIVAAYGITELCRSRRLAVLVSGIVLVNYVFGCFVYYGAFGKEHARISASLKGLLKTTEWIEQNIPPGPESTILGGGVALFYLYRKPQDYFTVDWWNFRLSYDPVPVEDLIAHINRTGVRYVMYNSDSGDHFIAPYLSNGTMLETAQGRFVPLQESRSGDYTVILYRFEEPGYGSEQGGRDYR